MSLGGGGGPIFRFWCPKHDNELEPADGPAFFLPTRNPGEWEMDLSDMWCPREQTHTEPMDECSHLWTITEVKYSGDTNTEDTDITAG